MPRLLLALCCLASLACTADPDPAPAESSAQARPAPRPSRAAQQAPGPAPRRFAGDNRELEGGDPEAVLEAMAADIRLQDGERAAMAAHYLRSGRRQFQEQDYRAAVQELEKAVGLDMRNEEALRLLQRAHMLAGDKPAYAETLDALAEEREASVDERRHAVSRWFREGEELLQLGRYSEAEQRFERVLEALRWSEVPLESDSLHARTQAYLVRAQVMGRSEALRRREAQERAAQDAAERERERER